MFSRTGLGSIALIGPLLVAPPLLAQCDGHDPPVGYVTREILTKSVVLRTGIGTVNDLVTTPSKEAQSFYAQGLAYLHSYVWIEAARSFNQALRLDPKLAMAWWGLSRAYSGLEDPEAARATWRKAQALAPGASPREARRIAARGLQLDSIEDLGNAAKHIAYKKALDEALGVDIDDIELWLLRGNAEEPYASGRGQRGGAASTAFYVKVLALDADQFAAHHYLVHSYENIGQIDRALIHGAGYARLAAAIPHAHHMWAHDLRRVGRTQDAIHEFQIADKLENDYYAAEGIASSLDWHHQHNLNLLAQCFQHEGQMKTTERLMREAFAIAPVVQNLESHKVEWPLFLMGRGRIAEAREAAAKLAAGKWAMARTVGHALLGEIALVEKDLDAARSALALARKELATIPTVGWYDQGSVSPYVDALDGEVLLLEGRKREARTALEAVEKKIRAVKGPDGWSQGLFRLESIARFARQAGDADLVAFTANEMAEHDAAFGGTQYLLGLVAESRGRQDEARKAYESAVRLWKGADPDLTELVEIRVKLAAPTAQDEEHAAATATR